MPSSAEQRRLAALRHYEILDTPEEAELDELVALAAELCDAPIAILNLVDEDRQWFKSRVGLESRETGLDVSICKHTIRQDGLFVVPDTRLDLRFRENPLVIGEPHLRFYAGALLRTPEGEKLGTLCVLDIEPRELSAVQLRALEVLAHQVMVALELRLVRRHRIVPVEGEALHALLEIACDVGKLGAWSLTLPDLRLEWSEGARRIHEVDEGVGLSIDQILAFYDPADRETLRAAVNDCAGEGRPFDEELRFITAKGRAHWVRVIGRPLRDETGAIVKIHGAIQDVTDRRLAEQVLRESHERFELLSQVTNDTIWDWDPISDRLRWGEGIEKFLGHRREDLAKDLSSWIDHIHPDDAERVAAGLRAVLDSGGSEWSDEYRFLASDGRARWVIDRGYVVRDPAGRPTRVVGGMTDITPRREVEEKLREQATFLDKARDAILVRDLDHHIVYWNHGAERLYGYDAAEALGLPIAELLYRDPGQFLAATEATLTRGEWVGELTHYAKDGRELAVEGRWSLVTDEAGTPRAILAINTDITERKELERQFLRAQRMESVGTLAGGIAHDLNNVLAPILLSIGTLREDELDAERIEDLETIEACAQRGADMVRQLLTFARGGAEGRRPTDLRRIAVEVQNLVRDTFPKGIVLRLEAPDSLWQVKAEPTQMHQLMVNLAVNARDAMPAGGVLTIRLTEVVLDEVYAGMHARAKVGPHLCLEVADTGTGMPPEVVDRIFEPFFTTKEVGKGTGLGLSTAHAIVESHGGFIQVESEPDRGTCFRIYLPADLPAERRDDLLPGRSRLPRGSGELILVVDDEVPIRQVARRTLERYGYRTLLAAHGADAVALYAQHRGQVALVLTDLAMPVMDGAATIIALRSIDPDVRIIASSGHDANGVVSELLGAGVERFVPKPFTAESLLVAIAEVLVRGPTS